MIAVRSSNGVYGLKLDSGLVADPSAPKDAAGRCSVPPTAEGCTTQTPTELDKGCQENLIAVDAANAARVMCYSKDGSLYAYHDGTVIKVLSTADGSTLCEIARPRTLALVFSPNNSQ
eukprot:gene24807-21625_t